MDQNKSGKKVWKKSKSLLKNSLNFFKIFWPAFRGKFVSTNFFSTDKMSNFFASLFTFLWVAMGGETRGFLKTLVVKNSRDPCCALTHIERERKAIHLNGPLNLIEREKDRIWAVLNPSSFAGARLKKKLAICWVRSGLLAALSLHSGLWAKFLAKTLRRTDRSKGGNPPWNGRTFEKERESLRKRNESFRLSLSLARSPSSSLCKLISHWKVMMALLLLLHLLRCCCVCDWWLRP